MPVKTCFECCERKEPGWEPGGDDVTAPGTSQRDRSWVHWPEQILFQDKSKQHWAVLMSAGR